jgi:putative FmdB family regulatory protein
MPTYDYDCAACGTTLEIYQSMSEAPKRKCPECGALKLKRRIGTGAGILFRGSGFYETDYRSDSYKQAAEKDKPASDKPAAKEKDKDKGAAKDQGGAKEDGGSKASGSSSSGGKGSTDKDGSGKGGKG